MKKSNTNLKKSNWTSEGTINQRFKEWLESEKIQQATFAEMTGLDRSTVSNIVVGKTSLPKADFFIGILRHFPALNLRWLLLGEPPMLLDGQNAGYQVAREPSAGKSGEMAMEKLLDTVHELSKLVNELPALRERVRGLEEDVKELKKLKI